ncbi:LytTR family DNA-binding domain-containing protein [Reyranella sp.]|uniref:LytTR family DNA-binding domain-containing protein n=1 Tax=Reyranella sp. TaxID=1929291 RepID=UPI003BA99539
MERRSVDGREVAVWAALLTVSVFAHAHVEVANEASRGQPISFGRAMVIEVSSHLVVAALLPALYWLHRRWPIPGPPRNLLVHAAALLPFSLLHTVGMTALRLLWFAGIQGEPYVFPLTVDRLAYEFAKDIVTYGMLSAGVMAMRHFFGRPAVSTPAAAPPPAQSAEAPAADAASGAAPLPERFAVRKKGREILVEVADIDWIEAAGNYAVLHVGGDTLEIRSSLSRLEGELDPRRFVRVHKSFVVNVARIAEVTPWVSGDWRIRLQDGAEVNLSRRYRARFEALVPVRS